MVCAIEVAHKQAAMPTDKDNFAPGSFAWDPFKTIKTVVRGGYGITTRRFMANSDVVQNTGNINGVRQIANISCRSLAAGSPATDVPRQFSNSFRQRKVQCTVPTAGNAACITLPTSLNSELTLQFWPLPG